LELEVEERGKRLREVKRQGVLRVLEVPLWMDGYGRNTWQQEE
jgi:hypothetical protein